MISVKKSENLGNTFIGLVCAAFNLKDARVVSMPHNEQDGIRGTIYVSGAAYDYRDHGDRVTFIEAR